MLRRNTGLSKAETSLLVERILELMASAIADGQNVKISGFGTFAIRHKAPRIGRNPKTGIEATISERKVVTFRPSSILRDRVIQTADGDDRPQPKRKRQAQLIRLP